MKLTKQRFFAQNGKKCPKCQETLENRMEFRVDEDLLLQALMVETEGVSLVFEQYCTNNCDFTASTTFRFTGNARIISTDAEFPTSKDDPETPKDSNSFADKAKLNGVWEVFYEGIATDHHEIQSTLVVAKTADKAMKKFNREVADNKYSSVAHSAYPARAY